jgi:hypothetical protein
MAVLLPIGAAGRATAGEQVCWFMAAAPSICGSHLQPLLLLLFHLQHASLLFFKRFYVQSSCLEHDPTRVMPTCIYLACKVCCSVVSVSRQSQLCLACRSAARRTLQEAGRHCAHYYMQQLGQAMGNSSVSGSSWPFTMFLSKSGVVHPACLLAVDTAMPAVVYVARFER